MQLHHLIYESQATQPFTEAQLAELLHKARLHNEASGLSGLLLYAQDGRFVQVLEGNVEAIHDLYFLHIARDSRHDCLTLLADGTINQRRFADWRMGFRPATSEVLTELTGHFSTADAAFMLPMLPNMPSLLVDKLLDYVHYAAPDPVLDEASY